MGPRLQSHTPGADMKTFMTMENRSDISVIDTEQLDNRGIEINTRDGRTWTCLTLESAIEQLSILQDQNIRGAALCIATLEAERLVVSGSPSVMDWLDVDQLVAS